MIVSTICITDLITMPGKLDSQTELPDCLIAGRLSVNLLTHHVEVDHVQVTLTPKAFILLKYLMLNVGEIITREQLLREVWGWEPSEVANPRIVDMRISELRRKLGCSAQNPVFIETALGRGYRFIVEVHLC